MDINIENYLNKDEIKVIVESELRNKIANMGEEYLTELVTGSVKDSLISEIVPKYKEELNNRVKKTIEEESYFIYHIMESGGKNIIKQYLNDNPELLIEKIKQIKDDQYNDRIIEVFGSALVENIIENMKKEIK